MRTPRLLPLVAVAVGGVLGLKALDAAGVLPAVLADVSAARAAAPARPAPKPDGGAGPQSTPPKPTAAVCAPTAAELAKEAGLSPAELQMLQSLGTRRGQLDAREQALDTQMQLLAAAELKVDGKIKTLNAARAQVEALVGQADAKTAAEVDRLVVVYEKMKPRDAGAIFATLDDKVRVPVAAKIAADKPAILGQILAAMGTLEAKKLTESLAHRFDAARAAAEAVQKSAAPQASAAPAADPKAQQVASTDGAAADAPADAKEPTKDAGAAKPRRPAAKRRSPSHAAAKPTAAPAKPASPAAEAAPPPAKTAFADPKPPSVAPAAKPPTAAPPSAAKAG